MKKLIFLTFLTIIIGFSSCEKIPYDQYYVWENNTDTTIIVCVNPPKNDDPWYYWSNPSEFYDKIWPPTEFFIIKPKNKYILSGSIIKNYYDIIFIYEYYPPRGIIIERWNVKSLNIINIDGSVANDRY